MRRLSELVLGLTAGGLKRSIVTVPMIRHLIQEAFDRNLVLEIVYTDHYGQQTTRAIEVGSWYDSHCKAHCRLRGAWRAFRYDQIRSARWTGEVFVPQPAPKPAPVGKLAVA